MPADPTPTLDLATLEAAEAEARGEAASLRHTLAIIGAERAAALAEADEMRAWAERAAGDENANARELEVARQERDEARAAADRLRVLGPDTEVRVTCEARELASAMMQPAISAWREALAKMTTDRDDLALTLANERGEGAGPSDRWTWIDGAWRILDDFGGNSVSVRAHDTGRWHWRQHDPYARSKFPLHSARAAMLAADAALKAGGSS